MLEGLCHKNDPDPGATALEGNEATPTRLGIGRATFKGFVAHGTDHPGDVVVGFGQGGPHELHHLLRGKVVHATVPRTQTIRFPFPVFCSQCHTDMDNENKITPLAHMDG